MDTTLLRQKRTKIAQAELNRLITLQEAYVAGNQADLSGASFVGAKLGHARFDKAHLGNLCLLSGEILSPSFCDAKALPVQLRDTIMDDSLEALGLEELSES